MDLSSLSNGLPKPADDSSNIAFKEAALALTQLYKTCQGARREGYLDAVDEVFNRFLDVEDTTNVDLSKLVKWIRERKRKQTMTDSSSLLTTEVNECDTSELFETIPVCDVQSNSTFSSTPLTWRSRSRILSPNRNHSSHHRQHIRSGPTPNRDQSGNRSDDSSDKERRERERTYGVKRRVKGASDALIDLHKRARFG